ncbi:LapA family protein [Pseudomonas donghuensis]|uniref:LapA family protein n=1 Tax=Pseudomonas donghuensis TaxID=1163398 RepID=UPI0020C3B0F6|nr:LapA family protein [Pseudomonas donghuensis]MCP6699723.1 LapA family protein [Pseudomonas donghuensis]
MRNIKRLLLALLVLVLAGLTLFFVLENQQTVSLVLFGWSSPALPLSVVVLLALIAGLLVGPLMAMCMGLRTKARVRRVVD